MIDKADVRIPYSASLRPDFKFLMGEIRYAGMSNTIQKSQHYQGTCDLRPFGIDAIAHLYFKGKGPMNHKFEIVHAGQKSLDQMCRIITAVFDVDPNTLQMMRVDFAADTLYTSLRVKNKRCLNTIGEFDYETVGSRQIEYFRYGKSPNCVRVYDKPVECKARFKEALKHSNLDAEPPSFEDVYGFPESIIMSRTERQSGGGRVPVDVDTIRKLYSAADYNPFQAVEYIPETFPLPDPRHVGESRSIKLIGLNSLIKIFGYQQTRAMLNINGNAKRMFDDYADYIRGASAVTGLTVESIVESYRLSTLSQIDGSIEKKTAKLRFLDLQKQQSLKSS